VPPVVIRNDSWTWKDIYHHLYEENAFANIVISPGPGSPTCPADVGKVDADSNFCLFSFIQLQSSELYYSHWLLRLKRRCSLSVARYSW